MINTKRLMQNYFIPKKCFFSSPCSYLSLSTVPAESGKERTSLILRINHAVKLKSEATSLSGQHLPARSLTTVGLGISKLLSFEKTFASIQALLRHNEYSKANYKKKLRYLQKNL